MREREEQSPGRMRPGLRDFLPAAGLQHVGFVQAADGQALHRSLQVFADFK